jgi:rubrerythrin
MNGIGKTEENLKAAISGETFEFKEMYPDMIEAAKAESDKNAERSFTYANAVEEVHAGLYKKALDSLASQEDVDYYVCAVCGYTCENEVPEECPVCNSKASVFSKVD